MLLEQNRNKKFFRKKINKSRIVFLKSLEKNINKYKDKYSIEFMKVSLEGKHNLHFNVLKH